MAQPTGLIRDRYEALDVLGRGGQGEVYKALDHQHGRVVALKLRAVPDDDQRQALLAEARILLSLRPHPNLPLVREDFFWEDRYVLVMDWVEGTDMASLLIDTGDPGLPVSSVLGWMGQAAAALDHLHGQGVVHGDVKPANLVLTPEGRVVLVDFGISRYHDDSDQQGLGSPGYAAPELVAQGLGTPADVYGLAATSVALLTGAPPSGGRPTWEGVPNAAAIERAIRRGLSVDPSRRPRSATELVERLKAHLALDLPTGVVTFLLTDIEGSTLRWEEDPDGMADLIAHHDGLVADAVETAGGRLLKTRGEGDSTFSVFTRASDAASAALAAQRRLLVETDLRVRMAIHSGEAETRDGDYFGRTVNRASRLRAIARGGQVLLSSAAADLVVDALPEEVALVDLGYRELRDLARGEQVFALSHDALDPVTPSPSSPPAPPLPPQILDRGAPVPGRARSGFDDAEPERVLVDAPTRPPGASVPSPHSPTAPPAAHRPLTPRPAVAKTPTAEQPPPLPPAMVTARTANFVGRRTELDRLTALWERCREGERRLVLLAGEPGIGKTQLAIELAAAAHDTGATVLHGRCDDGLQVPYQPFATALSQIIDDGIAAGTTPPLGRLAGELVRLVPDLPALVPGLAPSLRADPETEQYRLFDAVGLWLQAQAEHSPLVVVLDDVHWATRPTLHLLRHVLRSSEPVPLLILATYRDSEIGRGHPLGELLADLHRIPGMERLVVDGLGEDEVVDLLHAGAGHDLGPAGRELARSIHELTDGNPFFVRELLRHLVESGTLSQGVDGRWTVKPTTQPLGVPEGVREVVGRRLTRLSEATIATLELAAVIGADFELDVLVAAGGFDEDDVLAALDEAVAARLVEESGPMRFRFSHAIVRATISDGLTRARRSRAHRRVAEAIEHRYVDDLAPHLTVLAMHYAEAATAGDGTKAVEYATRAGDLATDRLAHEEAVNCYRLARDLLVTTAAPVDERTRCALLVALGEAERLANDPAHRATLLEASHLALRWRDGELAARAAIANARSALSPVVETDPERVEVLEGALALIGPDDSAARARLLSHLSLELTLAVDTERGGQLADQALAVARRLDDPALLAEVLVLRSHTVVAPEALAERLALADQQLTLAAELGDPVLETQANLNGAMSALEGGDIELMKTRLNRARELAETIGQQAFLWQVLMQDARVATVEGRFEDAETISATALEMGAAAGHLEAVTVYGAQLATLRWIDGRLDEISGLLRDLVATRPDEPVGQAVISLSLIYEGRTDEARRWYEPIVGATDPPFPDNIANAPIRIGCLVILAGACAELRDVEGAQRIIDALLPYRDTYVDDGTSWGGAVAGHLVRLYTLLGRFDDAESCVRQALAMYDRIGSPPMTAIANTDWAELCLARGADGDLEHGRRLLANSLALTERLGQRWHGERVRRLLDAYAEARPARVASAPAPIQPIPAPVEAASAAADPFVGHPDELQRMERALADAVGGATRIVLVSGESGAGKTRMLDELGARAVASGATVLRGRSLEGTGEAYQPFIDALTGAVVTTPIVDLPRLLGRLAPELCRLLPELADLLPGSPEPVRSDPDTERYRLFDSVVGWLRATAAERPVALLLDDLQWAGKPTLQLLRHVTRSLTSAPIVIAVAYRGTELGRTHPLAELLADLHRLPGVERLQLDGLALDDVALLLSRELDRPVDEIRPLAETIEAATTGNPFFVRELVRHLAETGAFAADDALSPSALAAVGVPEGVRSLVARRVGRLAPQTRVALEAAAVIGDDIEITTLGAAVDLDEDELLAALDEAVAASILGEVPGIRPRYRFSQDIVRVTLFDAIDDDAQRALHRRVGLALESSYRDSLEDHLPDLARHFTLAGDDPVRAVDYTVRLGDRALERLADDEAAACFRRALDIVDSAAGLSGDESRRADILVHLGEAQRRMGDPAYRDTLFTAFDTAERLGDLDMLVRAATANHRQGFSALGIVDDDRVARLRRAVALVGADDSPARAILLSQLAVELMFSGDFGERLTLSSEALAVARRLDDPLTLARVLGARIEAIGHASTFDERLRLNGEQLELASRLSDPNLGALAALNRYYLMLTAGDRAEADRFQRRAAETGANSSQPMLAWIAAATSANQAFIDGRFEEAEQLVNQAFQLGQHEGQPDALVVFTGQIGVVLFFQGRLKEFEGLVTSAAAATPPIPALTAAIATMLCELDRVDEARPIFEALAVDGFAAIPDDLVWLSGVALASQVCYRLGDAERAEQLFALLRPYAGRFVSEGTIFLGSVDRFLALLSTTMQRWDDADRWFASALAGDERLRAAPFTTLTRGDWATMLVRRGRRQDRPRTRQLVEECRTDAERLGMAAVLASAEGLSRQLSQPMLPTPLASGGAAFVGRSGEVSHLRELLNKADSGTRQLVLVAGEPGIGKTSLASALAREAHARGAVVMFGRCDEDAVVPLQPFVEVLRDLLSGGGAGELPPEVVRLLPELDTEAGRADTGDPAARYRLFDSLGGVLDRAAGDRTCVLVVDDLHWADQPTLLAIRHLVRRSASRGLLVLGTYRDGEVSRTHPLADVLAELRRERLFDRIVLRGLSSEEVVELVAHLSGHELDDGDVDFAIALGSAADGNPFFIEEILRHLVETGALVHGLDGRWDTDAASWDDLGVPEGVREVIGRRLSRLSPTGEQVMAAGAVLGRAFAASVVRRMVDVDDDSEIDDALAEAVGLRLLDAVDDDEPTFAFGHALVRETLYDELSLPRRQRLHLRAADAIEATAVDDQGLADRVGALAVHLRQAGAAADPERAVEWSVRAAEAAFRVFAYEEAAGHFEGAVAILTELGGRDSELRRARLHERLLKLRFFTGSDPGEGVRHGEAALEVYERYGEQHRAAMIHSQLGAHLATAGTVDGLDVARGLRHLEAAEAVLGDGDDRATGYFHVSMANATVRALRLDDVERSSRRAIAIADALGDRALWANASLLRGLGLFERGEVAAGGDLVDQALAAATEADSPAIVLLTAWNRGYQLLALDDPAEAEAMFAAQLAAPRFTDAPRAAAALRLNHSRCLFELGRLDEIESSWTGTWAPAVGDRYGADPAVLAERLQALLAEQRSMGDVWTMLWHQPIVSSVFRRLGVPEAARTVVEDGIALALSVGSVPPLVALRCEAALLDPGTGAAHVEQARELVAKEASWRSLPVRVDHAAAAVAAAAGDTTGAVELYAATIAGYQHARRPWAEADARLGWAAASARAGDEAAAAEHRAAARSIYARIGAAPHWSEHA